MEKKKMMEYYHPLDVTVISAEDLKDVNLISKMKVYVEVSIADDPVTKRRTSVDKVGGKNPKWNDRLRFAVDDATLARNPRSLNLVFRLRSKRLLCDRDIGSVTVPIKALFNFAPEHVEKCHVYTPSVKMKIKGTLIFYYKFGDKVALAELKNSDKPTYIYAAPQQEYPAAAAPAYRYKQQNNLRLGLGASFFGGMLMGDMMLIGC